MIAIGQRNIPSTFIKNIKLEDKAIVVSFYLNRSINIYFRSHKAAREEYEKAKVKLANTIMKF